MVRSPSAPAGDDPPPDIADARTLAPADRVVPTWTEPLARRASMVVGGPLGTHALVGRHWFWTPLRVVLLLATLVLAVSWLAKSPCLQTWTDGAGVERLDWRDARQYQTGCYSDTVPLFGGARLDRPGLGGFPYATSWEQGGEVRHLESPVLAGLFQWGNAKLAQAWVAAGVLPASLPVIVFFNLTAWWLALAWLVTVWALVLLCRRRPWDAALAAVSPLVLVHAFTGIDTLATAAAAVGLLAWARRRPVLAGVLLGMGGAVAPFPLLLLVPLLALCVRAGRLCAGLRAAGAAALAWGALNVPVAGLFLPGWSEGWRVALSRPPDHDSLYSVVPLLTGAPGLLPGAATTVSALLLGLVCAAVAWLALAAPRRPRLAQLCFLVVCAFLLVGTVWRPQSSLWLVPLAVLALPRWRPLLAWMLLDALVWVPRMAFYLGTDRDGLPVEWFAGAVLLRDVMVVALCVLVVREVWRPRQDVLRADGPDGHPHDNDPHGGVLDGATDAVVMRTRWRPPVSP